LNYQKNTGLIPSTIAFMSTITAAVAVWFFVVVFVATAMVGFSLLKKIIFHFTTVSPHLPTAVAVTFVERFCLFEHTTAFALFTISMLIVDNVVSPTDGWLGI
jgi:hypothetical protein